MTYEEIVERLDKIREGKVINLGCDLDELRDDIVEFVARRPPEIDGDIPSPSLFQIRSPTGPSGYYRARLVGTNKELVLGCAEGPEGETPYWEKLKGRVVIAHKINSPPEAGRLSEWHFQV